MNIKRLIFPLILGLGLTLTLLWTMSGGLPLVHAASFTVNSKADGADPTPNDGTCDIGGGICTLRAAIQTANNNGEADTINLGIGTFTLSIPGTGENQAASGDLDITKALTITGLGPDQTTIDADGLDAVFDIRSGAGTVVISGVTIINGNWTGWGGASTTTTPI